MSQNTRDQIRAAFFSIKTKFKIVQVAGVDVEVRQPSVEDILASSVTGDNRSSTMVKMVCDHCYVPGTNDRIFEPEDAEAIMKTPFGKDWQALNGAINDLSDLGASMAEEKGNSAATPAA